MHYDSIVCSTLSEDHFQTKIAFCIENQKLLPDFARVSSCPTTRPVAPPVTPVGNAEAAPNLWQRWKESPSHLLTSFPHLSGPLSCSGHVQWDYNTALYRTDKYLSFNWFTFLSSQWNLTSEFLKLSLAQEFLPCLWLSQGPQVILPRPVPSWLCSHHVFWYSVTSSCRNIY